MKKMVLSLVVMMTAAFASARNVEDKPTGTASVAVTNVAGSNVFKLYYKAPTTGKVKVSILDSKNLPVFSETILRSSGFARPYNFDGLREGEYPIQIEDASGKMIEKVNYRLGHVEKLIKIIKVAGEENKYLLTVASQASDAVGVKIFDDKGGLLLSDVYTVDGEFAQVFHLKKVNSFTIQVEDRSGILKSITY